MKDASSSKSGGWESCESDEKKVVVDCEKIVEDGDKELPKEIEEEKELLKCDL